MLDNTQDQNQEQEDITPVISQGLTSNAEPPIPPSGVDPNSTATNMFGETFQDLNPPRLTSTRGVYDDLMQRYPIGSQSSQKQESGLSAYAKQAEKDLQQFYALNQQEESKVDLNPNNIAIDDVYTTLSDGTLSRKYDDFLVGVDNEERLAQNQSTASKWGNGLAKFVGKTATNVIGGTIGTLVSIPQAISEGSFTALYDNDFQNSLDDINTIMDNKLSNYYSKDEQDMNFGEKLLTSNFWANDVTNGLSFLVGAGISEGIWAAATGGASLTTTVARLGTRMPNFVKSALSLHKGIGRNLLKKPLSNAAKNQAIKNSNWAKAGNTLRFAMTSAGYESGVEARHYLNQAKSNFLQQYALDNNGAVPSAEEMSTFTEDAKNSANALFGFNMALVGGSNVMTLGKLFGVMPKSSGAMTTGAKGYLNKKLFGLGVKGTAEEGFEKIGRKKFQKLALGGYSKLKTPFREGFIEEGGQASASNAAEKWLESRYSSQAQDKNIGVMKSFYEGLSHTYGTKEGWNEIGIGMLIGALGGAVNGEFSSGKDAVKNLDSEIDTRNRVQTQEYALRLFKSRMENSSQMTSINEEIEEASLKNDLSKQQDATMRLLTTKVDLDYELGDQNASSENLSMLMDSMTDQQISDSTGVGLEEVAEYKKEILEQFQDVQKRHIKNREYADAIFGDSIQDKGNDIDTNAVKKALAFTLTMGENSYDTANLMLSEAQELIGESALNAVLTNYDYITGLDKESLKDLNTIKDKLKVVDEKLSEVDKELGIDFAESEVELNKGLAERLNVSKQGGFKNTKQSKREINKSEKEAVKSQRELEKLNKLTDRKIKLEKKKAKLSDDLQDVNVSMNARNSFGSQVSTGIDNNTATGVTLDMLRDMDTDINKLNKILSKMSKSDPQRASQISKLLKEYGVAKNNLKKYNEVTQQLVTGDYSVTTKSMFNRKKLDAQTRSLIDKLQKEAVLLSASMASDTSTITQEEYDTWKETSELTPELIRKVMAQEETGILSKKERLIYEKHKEEIDKAIEAKKSREGDSIVDKDTDTQTTTETSPKTVRDKYIEKIKKALSNNSVLQYVGIDVENSKRPTKEEIDRYKFLKNEIRKKGTPHNKIIRKENPKEGIEQEFQKLNTKLANWRLMDSAIDENGSPLVTSIDMLEMLEQERQEEEIASEATEEDIIKETSSIQDGNTNNNDKSVTQIQETAVVKHENYEEKKGLVISHLKLSTILDKLPEGAVVKFFNDKGKPTKSVDGASRVSIKIGANSFNIELLSRGRMRMSRDDFNNLPTPYRTLKPYSLGGSWSDLYQVMKNGILKIVESDFKLGTSSLTKLFKFDFKTLSETKVGDELDIVLDFRTDYNTNQLKAEYEAGLITVDDVVRNVQIFLKRKDGIVSMLKASEEDNNDNPTHTMIRKSFREDIVKFLENDPSVVNSEVKSDIRVPVKKVWIGRPKLSARPNENNQAVLDFKEITKKGADRIVDYGFVDSEGNFELKNGVSLEKGTYRDMTIDARKNKSKKIPIIVISEGNNKLIMRVNLKKTTLDFTEQVEEIERSKINRDEKANELIALAVNNGLDGNNYITEEYIDVNKLLEDLNDLEFSPSTDAWLSDKSHNKFSLVGEITVPLDLDESVMTAPKLQIDLDVAEQRMSGNMGQQSSTSTQEDLGTPVNEDVFLTEQDRNELISFALGSDNFKTLDDIRVALGKGGLIANDRVVITEQTLTASGLYNNLEVRRIMSSQANIDALEGLINRIAVDMDSSKNFDLSGVDNSFAVYSSTEFTTLGTAKVVNDTLEAKNNFFKSTVGMKQDKFTDEVLKSEFENLRKKFEQEGSDDFQNALYNESRKYVLVEKINQSKEVMDSMLNIPESQDQELEESLLFIKTMTEDTWQSESEDVKKFLSNIQDMMSRNYSLVLPNLSELYDTSNIGDIQNMLTNIKGILNTLPEDTSTQIQNEINKVTGAVSSEIGSTTEVIRLEDDKAEELRGRTLVSMVTDKSIYETFKESGLVYVAKGIYQRVTKSKSLEDMYKSFLKKRNIEGVKTIEDLKKYIQSKRSEVSIPEGIDVDESLVEMLTLYTEYFNNPYTKNDDVYTMDKNDMSQEFVSSLQDIDYDYLETDFVNDLRESDLNDSLKQILNFITDGKGGVVIEVKQGVDSNFFRSVLESNREFLGENNYNNLVNYLMLSKTKNPINTNVESMIFESESSEALQRDIYINNPNKLDKFTKDFEKPNDDVAIVNKDDLKGGEDFIRLSSWNLFGESDVYERVDQRGSRVFFAKLPNLSGTNINMFRSFPRPTLKGVDIEDYSTEEVGKPIVKPNTKKGCK